MKKIYIVIILSLVALVACDKEDFGLSDCLNNKIREFEKSDYACTKGANVKEYEFMNEKVYVFDPGLCGADMTLEVMDEDCNTLGYLGGLIGNMKINGIIFITESKFIKTIWER
ncbi:MAG: hypothetical protein KKG99_14450 [Bacteroidetes bacterium]|nr:hypothetical protein [Bacteroidota bacterium]